MTTFGNLDITFEPLFEWPGARTKNPGWSPFRAEWGSTLDLLRKEVDAIRARRVVVQAFFKPAHIRQDGLPRANAPSPTFPGVILSIAESDVGRLRLPCDTYNDWQDNIRAIALSMEKLRAVDRYGVTKGSQYKGLPGAGGTAASMTATEAASVLSDLHFAHASARLSPQDLMGDRDAAGSAIKRVMVRLHPDMHGGVPRPDWHRFIEAKHALERHHGAK